MKHNGITLKEIARLLDISPTTVSRVLNGQARQYRISLGTEKKVKDAAKKLHFAPNLLARNLRLKRTNTIGLAIPDISDPFFASLSRIIEIELRKRSKLILLCDTRDDSNLESESLALLRAHKVDGLLVVPVGLTSEYFEKLIKTPLVLIDRYFQKLPVPYVSSNYFQGAYDATSYLINRHHYRIACIQGLKKTIANSDRVNGFSKAICDSKIPKDNIEITGSEFSIDNGYYEAKKVLQKKNIPTAIFALSNQIAIGTMMAIKEEGLRVPEDVSIIAFDDHPSFTLTSPPLTTIAQAIKKIGKEAVNILMDLMEGRTPKSILLPLKLIERDSVRVLN